MTTADDVAREPDRSALAASYASGHRDGRHSFEAALTAAKQRIAELEGELREEVEERKALSDLYAGEAALSLHLSDAVETAAASMRERAVAAIRADPNYTLGENGLTEYGKTRREAFEHAIGRIAALPLIASPQGDDGGEVRRLDKDEQRLVATALRRSGEVVQVLPLDPPNSDQPLTSGEDGAGVRGALNKDDSMEVWMDDDLAPYVPDVIRYDDAGVYEFVINDNLHVYEERDDYAVLLDRATGGIVGVRWAIPKATPPDAAGIRAMALEDDHPVVERLRWTTETLQAFLDTFGDLGDRVTAADINDTWEMLRSLAAAPGGGWQPIETVPLVDPECPSRGPVVWLGGKGWAGEGWWGGDDEPQWIMDRDDGEAIGPVSPPTHWMPWHYPAPPQEGEGHPVSKEVAE